MRLRLRQRSPPRAAGRRRFRNEATDGGSGRVLISVTCLLPLTAAAQQQQFFVKPVAEKKLEQLPSGPLYWRMEKLPTLAQAQAAAGPTSLAVDLAGNAWLFTLGSGRRDTRREPGRRDRAGTAADDGRYLLRINHSGGPPGSKPVHTHPGSEAFYVLSGRRQRRRTA